MKKLIAVIAVVATVVAWVAYSHADSTNVMTNAVGQVVTTVTDANGTRVTSITSTQTGASVSRTQVSLVGAQLSTTVPWTEAAGASTKAYTPRDIGDMLIHLVSNKVYMAVNVGTNGWVLLN